MRLFWFTQKGAVFCCDSLSVVSADTQEEAHRLLIEATEDGEPWELIAQTEVADSKGRAAFMQHDDFARLVIYAKAGDKEPVVDEDRDRE